MKRFGQLFEALDATTSTSAKVDAMVSYLSSVDADDAAWAVYFLAGGKPKQLLPTRLIREVARHYAGVDEWLFEECYQAVGDLAETIAHILPPPTRNNEQTLASLVQTLRGLRTQDEDSRRAWLLQSWDAMNTTERFLLVKLIGGGFRVGVSKLLVVRALAQVAGIDPKIIAQRFMGYVDGKRQVAALDYERLIAPHSPDNPADERANLSQPYPFFLAHPLADTPASSDRLGEVNQWFMEWKFDGIRAQIVRRGDTWAIWSRGEELITETFPELASMAGTWPDGTVLDGEILVWLDDKPADFAQLQTRLGRKAVSKKMLQTAPVIFMAYDCLEWRGQDLRQQAHRHRRATLEQFTKRYSQDHGDGLLKLSPAVIADSWEAAALKREQSRVMMAEGLMLKHVESAYGVGRTKDQGLWLKWKVDPMTVDCVLIYAQRGHGRRASLYTDYTFAVWDRPPANPQEAALALEGPPSRNDSTLPKLVPFAKAYSGLSDEEFKVVDAVIRKTIIDKFGPVRSVLPSLVFELGFEGIARSSRHKSGIAVRFPRMLRIREDKPLHEADSLAQLEQLIDMSQANRHE